MCCLPGLCAEGEGFSAGITGSRECSACPLNTYNNDRGSLCTPCEQDIKDTGGETGARKCVSK